MDMNLASLVHKLREELEQTEIDLHKSRKAQLLELKSVELEIHFAVHRSNMTREGFDFKIVSFGDSSEYSTEQIQKVTLKYQVTPEAFKLDIPGIKALVG